MAAIRKSGGKAYYDWEMTRTSLPDRVELVHISNELTPDPGERPPWPEVLVRLLGPDVFGDVVGVEIPVNQVLVGRDPNALVEPDPAEELPTSRRRPTSSWPASGGSGGSSGCRSPDCP